MLSILLCKRVFVPAVFVWCLLICCGIIYSPMLFFRFNRDLTEQKSVFSEKLLKTCDSFTQKQMKAFKKKTILFTAWKGQCIEMHEPSDQVELKLLKSCYKVTAASRSNCGSNCTADECVGATGGRAVSEGAEMNGGGWTQEVVQPQVTRQSESGQTQPVQNSTDQGRHCCR